MLLLRHNENNLRKVENRRTNHQKSFFYDFPVPSFDLGLNYLSIDSIDEIDKFVDDWFGNVDKFLRLEEYSGVNVKMGRDFLQFPSILNDSQIVKFKYDMQPEGNPGRKVALINVMHWNGRLDAYDRIISFLRNTFFPISTFIHIPASRCFDPRKKRKPDYNMLSPNIGKTIYVARQNILDLQFVAHYLKQELGYEEVGIFSYSIGSMFSMIASMMNHDLFDFGIFHLVCDDFSDAVMDGWATREIASGIEGNIKREQLRKMWSVISPGAYSEHFSSLPSKSRFVQAEYDFVFGKENVEKFNEKLINKRSDADIEKYPLSHTTLGDVPLGPKIMWRNLAFMYQHTKMKECVHSRIFL